MANGKQNGKAKDRPVEFPQPLTNEERAVASVLREFVNNTTMSRSALYSQLMDTRRDTDIECGYPKTNEVDATRYKALYDREPVAARVVEVLPKESWQVTPEVYEDEDVDVRTPFEIAWDQLSDSLRGDSWYKKEEGSPIWEYLLRADVLSGIGHFGIILLGFDDKKPLDQPVEFVADRGNPPAHSATPRGTDSQYTGGFQPPYGEKEDLPDEDEFIDIDDEEESDEEDQEIDPPLSDSPNGVVPDEEDDEDFELGGLDDEEAVTDSSGTMAGEEEQPVETVRKLLYIRVFDESLVRIQRYEADPTNPRYGQPVMYSITLNDPKDQHSSTGTGLALATVDVHWTRVVHVADTLAGGIGSSEIFSVPRMRPNLNRILDLVKLYGGSAEMYWRGAFPGLSLETHPQLGGDVSIDIESARTSLEKYMNTLQRYLINEGMTVKTLAPTVVDPTQQIDVQLTGICIQIGCPKRIFLGSERGELASGQDDTTWNGRLKWRQQLYITPHIIVPFVNRLIAVGVLPTPKSYCVEWPDLDALQPLEKAQLGLQRTQSIAQWVSGGCDVLISPMDFLTRILDFTEEEAESILEATTQHLTDANPDAEGDIVPGKDPTPDTTEVMLNPKTGEPIELEPGQKAVPGGGTPGFPPKGNGEFPPKNGQPPSGKFPPKKKPNLVGNYDPDQPRDDDGKWARAAGKLNKLKRQGKDHVRSPFKFGDPQFEVNPDAIDFNVGKIKKLAIKSLLGGQETVSKQHVMRYVRKDSNLSHDAPIAVVRDGKKLYIFDGHHRATAAWARGEKTIKAVVHDRKNVEVSDEDWMTDNAVGCGAGEPGHPGFQPGNRCAADDGGGGGGSAGHHQTMQGEYWLQNGSSVYADGDIGDMNHEGYAIDQAQQEVMGLMDAPSEFSDGDRPDWDGFIAWLEEKYEVTKAEQDVNPNLSNEDKWLAAMKEAGVSDSLYLTAIGGGDPRNYAVRNWGWMRVHGNDVQLHELNKSTLKELADGLGNAYSGNFDMDESDTDHMSRQSFNIESKTAYYEDVPWDVIDAGDMKALRDYKRHGTPGWGGTTNESIWWKLGRILGIK